MRSTLFITNELPEGNYYQVGTTDSGGRIIHGAPGAPIPPGADVVFDGSSSWKWTDIKTARSAVAENVLQARWNTGQNDEAGNPKTERGTIKRGKALGRIPTPIETDLPPHYWLGDEEDVIEEI